MILRQNNIDYTSKYVKKIVFISLYVQGEKRKKKYANYITGSITHSMKRYGARKDFDNCNNVGKGKSLTRSCSRVL